MEEYWEEKTHWFSWISDHHVYINQYPDMFLNHGTFKKHFVYGICELFKIFCTLWKRKLTSLLQSMDLILDLSGSKNLCSYAMFVYRSSQNMGQEEVRAL